MKKAHAKAELQALAEILGSQEIPVKKETKVVITKKALEEHLTNIIEWQLEQYLAEKDNKEKYLTIYFRLLDNAVINVRKDNDLGRCSV